MAGPASFGIVRDIPGLQSPSADHPAVESAASAVRLRLLDAPRLRLLGGGDGPAASTEQLAAPLRQAIFAARHYLLSQREANGEWAGRARCVRLTARRLLLAVAGERPADEIESLSGRLLEQQLPCGGWPEAAGGPASLDAGIEAYLALRAAGRAAHEPALQAARRGLRAQGGADAAGGETRCWLALFGQIPWPRLPRRLRRGQSALARLADEQASLAGRRPLSLAELFLAHPAKWPRAAWQRSAADRPSRDSRAPTAELIWQAAAALAARSADAEQSLQAVDARCLDRDEPFWDRGLDAREQTGLAAAALRASGVSPRAAHLPEESAGGWFPPCDPAPANQDADRSLLPPELWLRDEAGRGERTSDDLPAGQPAVPAAVDRRRRLHPLENWRPLRRCQAWLRGQQLPAIEAELAAALRRAACGHDRTARQTQARRLADRLLARRQADGRWQGRGQHPLRTTWDCLSALRVHGLPADDPRIAAAVHWIEARQLEDGGWSADEAERRSDPLHTAQAVLCLLSAGRGGTAAADRGVQCLMAAQELDGSWGDGVETAACCLWALSLWATQPRDFPSAGPDDAPPRLVLVGVE